MTVLSARPSSASEQPLVLEARDLHLWLCRRETLCSSDAFRREILSRYAPVAPAQWRFEYGEHGKPALVDPPRPLGFNLSHSADWMACAVTAGTAVGVDIEYCAGQRDVLKLARRFFQADELSDLQGCDEAQSLQRFYDYWTLKESAIKARGMALGLELEKTGFDVLAPAGSEPGLIKPRGPAWMKIAHFSLLAPQPNYRLATCWLGGMHQRPRLDMFELRSGGVARALPVALRACSNF